MVVYLDVVHHPGFLVPLLYPQDIAFNAVVKRSRGDFDFALGAADIVPHRVDLVDGVGYQPVSDIEGADTDKDPHQGHREQDTGERNARGFHCRELELLAHISQRHHGAQEGGQRNGEREHLAASPHEELQDHLELQSLAHQFVDVQPQELHDQNKRHHREDRNERPREGFQDKLV